MLLSDVLYDSKAGEVSLTMRMVNVETAKIATAISKYESVRKIHEVFDKIPIYLLELYRNQNKESNLTFTPTQSQAVAGQGKLIITSKPVGAKVILDNKDAGLTPVESDIEAGKHRVVLTFDGYERFTKTVTLIADSVETIDAELEPLTGDLSVICTPPNGDVFINDVYKGKTPLNLKYMDVGDYFVKITHPGYKEELKKIKIDWQQLTTVKKTLNPLPGSVAFYSIPNEVTVLIDGKSQGATDMTGLMLELSAGKHEVSMKKKGYITETTEIDVKPGETTDLELSLTKLPDGVSEDPNAGWITIKGSPKQSQILIQGETHSSPLKYHELKKGSYSFTAKQDGYKSYNGSFTIQAQKHFEQDYLLTPIDRKKAKKLSLMFPGLGHFYAENTSRGMLWSVLGVASIYGTAVMANQYIVDTDAYKDAETAYLAATEQADITQKFSVYNDSNDAKLKSLIGTSAFGVATLTVWIWNAYDVGKVIPSVFDMPVDIGLNSNGYIEASIAF